MIRKMKQPRPDAGGWRAPTRQVLPWALAGGALLVAVGVARAVAGRAGDTGLLGDGRHVAVFALGAVLLLARAATVRAGREVWLWFGAGLVLNTIGEALWAFVFGDAQTTPADAVFLAGYVAYGVGLSRYLRRRVGDALPSFSLDALGIAVSIVAVLSAVLVERIARTGGDPAGVAALNLAYPAMDVAILAVILAVSTFTGRRRARQDRLLAATLVVMAVADGAWVLRIAGLAGAGVDPWLDVLWEIAPLLLAAAAWARPATAGALRVGGRWETAPTVAWLRAGAGVLVAAWAGDGPPVVVVLGVLTIILGAVRGVRVAREVRTLVVTRAESLVDEVSGAANQRALFGALELLLRERGVDGRRVALLICSLEGFNELTDTLGHEAARSLLAAVAARLTPAAPGTLARLEGDQFATIVEDGDPEAVAAALTAALAAPVAVEGVAVSVRPVFGFARFPEDATTPAGLARSADVARRDAKARGLAIAAYDAARDGFSRDRLELAADLRAALAAPAGGAGGSGGLWLAFQPQVDAATGAVRGLEALVRWRHPTRGELSPAELLPVAERSGQMAALTDWVVEHAVAEVAALAAAGRTLRVSVNVSAATLVDVGLPDRLAAALERHGAGPEQLVVEVTEDAVMVDHRRCLEVLGRIAGLGVEISIDDFGTGHSSLAQLHRLPADELKIDRRFVAGLGHRDPLDAEIVALVVGLGRRMGVRVVAEGIETDEDAAALAALECDLLQGFGVGRPMPAAELVGWLAAADAAAEARRRDLRAA
jgi:diguanylate cyclase (GGDEF)-like protein